MIFHSTSKRPILIAGNGVRESGACEALWNLAAKTNIPVLTTMNAVDLVQDEERIGFIGVYGNRVANMIVTESDLVISVGARLGLRQIGNKPEYFAPKAILVRNDVDQFELSRDIKADEEKYLLDAKEFILRLLDEDIPVYTEWKQKCLKARDILAPFDHEHGNYFMERLASLLPSNPIVAVDIGQNQCWAAQSLNLKGRNGRILIGGGYGSMGCGLPYAIGASFATGKGIVYCVTGDGGLQMNVQELQTVVSNNLPIKIIVANNEALGKIREIQVVSYGNRFAQTTKSSGYTVPDFEKVAQAYGIRAKTLRSYEDLEGSKDWIMDDKACLLTVFMPEDTLLLPKMNWNQKEMMPTLSDEVLTEVKKLLSE